MATVAASKTISFRSPYTGATFQGFSGLLVGRDGYISGGQTTDDGVTITVEPTTFVQRGLVVSSLADAAIPVPVAAEPWFVIAATPDDDPDSGALFTVTTDLAMAAASVVVATRANGAWVNPSAVNIAGAAERASDAGGEVDLGIYDVKSIGGSVNSIAAYKGLVVDPSGRRVRLRNDSANSARALSATPPRPNIWFDRDDHVVLRQVEPFSAEMKTVIGGAIGASAAAITLDSGAGVTGASFFAKRGGSVAEQWWAWGNAADLNIKGGPAGEAFGVTTLLSGTSISQTWVAGQRASDSAVVVLYVDDLDLRMVSFNATTGVQIDAPVTLESLPGQTSHVRATLDKNERLHVVFEHDEGPRHQVYYTKVGIALSPLFGVADVTPRIVNGSDSGLNDTWPSIGVDRKGAAFVAHIRGAGFDEFGDLVVVSLDPEGDPVTEDVVSASGDIGIDDGDIGPFGTIAFPGRGAVQTPMDNLRQASVVVTPHDEIYVFTIGYTAGLRRFVLAYGPGFDLEHGSKALNVLPRLVDNDYGYVTLAADAGEAGEIFLALKREDLVSTETTLEAVTLPTPLLTSGRMSTPLWKEGIDLAGSVDAFDNLHVRRGPTGEFVVSYRLGTAGKTRQCAAYGSPAAGGLGLLTWPIPQRHPKDLYLGTWSVPKDSAAVIDGFGKRFQIFNARPKKMNYPVLVGQNGDYQGFNSIAEAWTAVSHQGGGEVVLRSGIHRAPSGLNLYGGGVSVRGEGSAVVIAESADGFGTTGGFSGGCTVSVSGNVVAETLGDDLKVVRAGDVIELDTSGRHAVLRNLGRDVSGFTALLLEDNDSGAPVGTTAWHYASGVRFENLDIRLLVSAPTAWGILAANRPILRNVTLSGPTTGGIVFNECLDLLIDGLDLRDVVNTDADNSLFIDDSPGGVIRGVRLADGKGKLELANTEHLTLIDCTTDGADPTKVIYNILNRTTPLLMTNCSGRISAAPADLAYVITNVGKRIRQPEGGGALELEDDNTRASSITDDGIKLTSGSHQEFNSTTKDVVTAAVNERVRVAGDTITGVLVPSVGGLDFGSLTNRWDLFAVNLDVSGDIVPTVSGGNVGSPTNRWDAFLGTMDISGLVTGDVTPNASGQDLGSLTNRWDLFAATADISGVQTFGSDHKHTDLRVHDVPLWPLTAILNAGLNSGDYSIDATSVGWYWHSITHGAWGLRVGDRIVAITIHMAANPGISHTARLSRFSNATGAIVDVESFGFTGVLPSGIEVFVWNLASPPTISAGSGQRFFVKILDGNGSDFIYSVKVSKDRP